MVSAMAECGGFGAVDLYMDLASNSFEFIVRILTVTLEKPCFYVPVVITINMLWLSLPIYCDIFCLFQALIKIRCPMICSNAC